MFHFRCQSRSACFLPLRYPVNVLITSSHKSPALDLKRIEPQAASSERNPKGYRGGAGGDIVKGIKSAYRNFGTLPNRGGQASQCLPGLHPVSQESHRKGRARGGEGNGSRMEKPSDVFLTIKNPAFYGRVIGKEGRFLPNFMYGIIRKGFPELFF